MTDHRMIFSAPMIRALLDGRKTQTRRIITRSNSSYSPGTPAPVGPGDDTYDWSGAIADPGLGGDAPYLKLPLPATGTVHRICPKWQPGDRIAVTETYWSSGPPSDRSSRIVYRATDDFTPPSKWRAPFALPRWASRITLAVTDVRPERVQDISEADARAEGAKPWTGALQCYRTDFYRIWDEIHGPDAWERNDWVWRIAFTVHACNIDAMEAKNA